MRCEVVALPSHLSFQDKTKVGRAAGALLEPSFSHQNLLTSRPNCRWNLSPQLSHSVKASPTAHFWKDLSGHHLASQQGWLLACHGQEPPGLGRKGGRPRSNHWPSGQRTQAGRLEPRTC